MMLHFEDKWQNDVLDGRMVPKSHVLLKAPRQRLGRNDISSLRGVVET